MPGFSPAQSLHKAEAQTRKPPFVYLCGAGPGAADLLTIRAYRLIASPGIDAVIYDKLVGEDVLALIPSATQKIYAGKSCRDHSMSQDEINARIVSEAKAGKTVLRLKGGDPFLFGRGGEETDALCAAGIPFEIVPGITAASAAAASCGIPLTRRGKAASVRFVTGHSRGGEKSHIAYNPETDANVMFAVYMGLARIDEIAQSLIAQGMSPATPCAAISGASLPAERRLFAPLEGLADAMRREGVLSPCLALIGRAAVPPERKP